MHTIASLERRNAGCGPNIKRWPAVHVFCDQSDVVAIFAISHFKKFQLLKHLNTDDTCRLVSIAVHIYHAIAMIVSLPEP